jgi:hypothetical protein
MCRSIFPSPLDDLPWVGPRTLPAASMESRKMSDAAATQPEAQAAQGHEIPHGRYVHPSEDFLATSATLLGAAFYIADQCGPQNDAFMKCKAYNAHPEDCLVEGRRVTNCVKHV